MGLLIWDGGSIIFFSGAVGLLILQGIYFTVFTYYVRLHNATFLVHHLSSTWWFNNIFASLLQAPASEIQDKISFIINNLSTANLEAKAKEIAEFLKEQYYPWFAQYMVMKR